MMHTHAHRRKHYFAPISEQSGVIVLFDIRWQPLESVCVGTQHTTMKTKQPGRLVGSRKSVFANITDKTHARLQRRAEASHLSAAKYTGVALEFFMDLEDAFGGPMTDQFRQMILRNVGGMAAKLEKALQ